LGWYVAQVPFFYGLQPRWLSWDRLFKLHVVVDTVAGAYVGGQIYDDASGMTQLVGPAQAAGPLMALWVRRIVRRRSEREARYESLIPGSAEFLAVDRRNFALRGADIERVIISSKRSLWTVGAHNSGSIRFVLWSGTQWRFLLVNHQDVAWINQVLAAALGKNRVECRTTVVRA
jgi:hypothetical protein